MTKTFIAQYDLRRPVPHLWGLTGYQDAFILVRDGDRPLDVAKLFERNGPNGTYSHF